MFVKCTEAGCGTTRGQGVLSSDVHGRLARWGVLAPGESGLHKAHHRTISESKNKNTARKDFFFFLKFLLYRPLYRLNSGRLGSFLKALRGSSVHFQRGKCVSQTMPKVFRANGPSPGGSSSGMQRWVASHRPVPHHHRHHCGLDSSFKPMENGGLLTQGVPMGVVLSMRWSQQNPPFRVGEE